MNIIKYFAVYLLCVVVMVGILAIAYTPAQEPIIMEKLP